MAIEIYMSTVTAQLYHLRLSRYGIVCDRAIHSCRARGLYLYVCTGLTLLAKWASLPVL